MRVLIPMLVVLPVAAVAGALLWIGVESARSSTEELAGRIISQLGSSVSQRVEGHLRVAGTASDSTLLLMETGLLDPESLREWPTLLWSQLGVFEGLSGIAFGRADGSVIWVAQYPGDRYPEYAILDDSTEGRIEQRDMLPGGIVSETLKGEYPYELFGRPWYVAGLEASPDEPAWSEIYTWATSDDSYDTLGVSYARPVYNAQNEFVGVLDAELELVELSQFLSSLRIGETGLAVLVEQDGRMVAASRVQGLLGSDGERRAVWEADDELTRALGEAMRVRVESGNGIGLEQAEVRAESWWVQVLSIKVPIGQDLNWRLIVGVPEDDLIGAVQETQEKALRAGLIAVGGALLIGVLGAMWLASPILKLRKHVRMVGEGDLDTTLSLSGAGEFVELGEEINAMQAGLKDRLRLRKSLELAMDVQQALLPDAPPQIAGLDIAGHSTYCDETGGDYYDYLEVAEITPSGLAVVLGDVMGHGIAAALLMATARGVIRSRANEAGSLGELLTHTNAQLVKDTGGWRFMTMLVVMLDPGQGVMRWSSAGQGPPMLYDPTHGAWAEFGDGGVPLGIVEDEVFKEHSEDVLRPGCVVLLGTDGLWEAQNEAGELFKIERVKQVIEENAAKSAEEISAALRSALDAHCGSLRPEDDVTYVVVKVIS